MNDGQKICIRPLVASDEPAWRDLWADYLRFYETEVSKDVYDTYFDRLIGNDPRDFNGLIAELNGKPVGLTHYLFHRHGWRIEDVCYLQDLYVDPVARGTGLGRKLIEAVYEQADSVGAGSVYWLTQEFNYTARQLYDRIAKKTPFIQYSSPRR